MRDPGSSRPAARADTILAGSRNLVGSAVILGSFFVNVHLFN
jgi:hypothetical protein